MDAHEPKEEVPMKWWYLIVPAPFLAGMWSRDWNQHRSFLYMLIGSVFFLSVYFLLYWGVSWSKKRNLK